MTAISGIRKLVRFFQLRPWSFILAFWVSVGGVVLGILQLEPRNAENLTGAHLQTYVDRIIQHPNPWTIDWCDDFYTRQQNCHEARFNRCRQYESPDGELRIAFGPVHADDTLAVYVRSDIAKTKLIPDSFHPDPELALGPIFYNSDYLEDRTVPRYWDDVRDDAADSWAFHPRPVEPAE